MQIKIIGHNPYFSRWFSAIKMIVDIYIFEQTVTILILVDGFLQLFRNFRIVYINK